MQKMWGGRKVLEDEEGMMSVPLTPPRHRGTVKFFNQEKGFGFIEREGRDDVFVHVSEILEMIEDGDSVMFEIGEGREGPMATSVRKVPEEGE